MQYWSFTAEPQLKPGVLILLKTYGMPTEQFKGTLQVTSDI